MPPLLLNLSVRFSISALVPSILQKVANSLAPEPCGIKEHRTNPMPQTPKFPYSSSCPRAVNDNGAQAGDEFFGHFSFWSGMIYQRSRLYSWATRFPLWLHRKHVQATLCTDGRMNGHILPSVLWVPKSDLLCTLKWTWLCSLEASSVSWITYCKTSKQVLFLIWWQTWKTEAN